MKRILSLTLVLTALFTNAAACTPNTKQAHVYEKKEVSAYPLKEQTPLTFACLFRDDLPEIPFADAQDYLNQLFTSEVGFQKGENGTYHFTNGGYTLTLDAEKDTLSCDSIEYFILENHKPYSEEEAAGSVYIQDNGFSTEDEVKPFFLDLGRYDIDVAENDGKVYLPFCTLSDLFADTGCAVLYRNGELFFKSAADTLNAGGGQGKLEDARTRAMAQFCYNELCMTMDTVYGQPSMAMLSDSIREKGFDKTLSEYNNVTKRIRELLQSEDTKDYCTGFRLLNYYLYDGGHTQTDYGMKNAMAKYAIPNVAGIAEELLDEKEPERAAIIENVGKLSAVTAGKDALVTEKEAAYAQLEIIAAENGASLYRAGDTYIFDFNAFENKAVKPFKEALDYAAANHAKNFVIDLSTNGGGSDYVVNYMLAVMRGEDTHRTKSALSDSVFRTNIRVDKNLDGVFDEKDDAVSYDFRFAVITSRYSYSNANCMPCTAQERNIAVLGEKSAGGCCIVTAHYFPDGCMYSISGSSKNIRPDGSDVDSGTVPDTVLAGAEQSYKGFFDINAINAGIDAFYQ